jgi:hypothetical protein
MILSGRLRACLRLRVNLNYATQNNREKTSEQANALGHRNLHVVTRLVIRKPGTYFWFPSDSLRDQAVLMNRVPTGAKFQ